jgi:V8-like Glu-specific endopeptidase
MKDTAVNSSGAETNRYTGTVTEELTVSQTFIPQYNCDTFGGMSGSALVVAGFNGKSLVVGVHTKGHGSFNSGILLTGDNKEFLEEILKKYPL